MTRGGGETIRALYALTSRSAGAKDEIRDDNEQRRVHDHLERGMTEADQDVLEQPDGEKPAAPRSNRAT
jgi:hypothetical protein